MRDGIDEGLRDMFRDAPSISDKETISDEDRTEVARKLRDFAQKFGG